VSALLHTQAATRNSLQQSAAQTKQILLQETSSRQTNTSSLFSFFARTERIAQRTRPGAPVGIKHEADDLRYPMTLGYPHPGVMKQSHQNSRLRTQTAHIRLIARHIVVTSLLVASGTGFFHAAGVLFFPEICMQCDALLKEAQ
jgi:hypothetical protein